MPDSNFQFSDTFLPMVVEFLAYHPWIALLAYLILKGLDAIRYRSERSCKELTKPRDTCTWEETKLDGEEIREPFINEFEPQPSFALSNEEINDHFNR